MLGAAVDKAFHIVVMCVVVGMIVVVITFAVIVVAMAVVVCVRMVVVAVFAFAVIMVAMAMVVMAVRSFLVFQKRRFHIQNGIEVKGVILNAMEKRAASYYGGNYGYYQYNYQSSKS